VLFCERKRKFSKEWTMNQGPPRFWFDFSIDGENIFIPVNVKVSTLEGNDNLSSKEGGFML
jgi:hypothetical protein